MVPQSFSRGFESVTTTIVPGWKGLAVPETGRFLSAGSMPAIFSENMGIAT
jgi:hypothetical protein